MLKLLLIPVLILTTAVTVTSRASSFVYQSILSPPFQQLSVANGLPTSRVFGIVQDHEGYIWAGTENGLTRYDGYQFQIFRHKAGDSNSISGNIIRGMFVDKQGRLWVGAYDGSLDLYHPDTGIFSHYTPSHSTRKVGIDIWAISGSGNKLWIGTFNHGLYLFDTVTGKFTHFKHESGNTDSLASNRINNIYIAKDGGIWLATGDGLDLYNPESHRFIHHTMGKLPERIIVWCITQDHKGVLWVGTNLGLYVSSDGLDFQKFSINNNSQIYGIIRSISFYGKDSLWIGTDEHGLYKLDTKTRQAFNITHDPAASTSILSDYIWDVFKGRNGILWIATDLGISRLTSNASKISLFKDLKIAKSTIPIGQITGLQAKANRLYIATSKGGFLTFIHKGKLKTKQMNSRWTLSFFIDPSKGDAWVGTAHGNLLHVSPTGIILSTYDLLQSKYAISNITSLTEENKFIWLGTFHKGLFRFNPKDGSLTPYILPIVSILWKAINELHLHGHTLLVGTSAGIALLDTLSGKAQIVPNPWGISGPYSVVSIFQYETNRYYLGTSVGLLSATFNPSSFTLNITTVPRLSGPDARGIVGIEKDGSGNLWLSSDYGLLKYSPITGTVNRFSDNQGMPLSLFTIRAHAKTSDSRLWFGGPFGLISFTPSMLESNERLGSIIINDLSYTIDNKSYKRLLPENVSLRYNTDIIQLNYSALNYAYPEGTHYRYRLLGLTSQWIKLGTRHQLILSRLSPGNYTLELEATTSPGDWSTATPTKLGLTILPPWWRTWWAYALYTLSILGAMFFYVYTQQRKLRREREISAKLRDADAIKSNFVKELESQVGQATSQLRNSLDAITLKNQELEIANQRASEGEQLKSQFLANMSHELRTPLTAIQGYLKLLSGTSVSPEQADYLRTVQHSSESLLSIINDTLDLSRIESGKLLIDEVDFNLLELIESTLELLGPSAYSKRLVLLRIVPPEIPLRLRGDPLRIRQILTNLVGNAIKFTRHGSICVRVQEVAQNDKEMMLGIAISDTGVGIPPEGIQQLFQAYERHAASDRAAVEGTGLGLSICKKLLDLMGGSIEVMSTPGIGSTFEFRLPFKAGKFSAPPPEFTARPRVALLDKHPLSIQAWRASLTRLGMDVTSARSLSALKDNDARLLIGVLGMDDMENPGLLAAQLAGAAPVRLVLAPTVDRLRLELLERHFACRVLSTLTRETVLAPVIRSLLPESLPGNTDEPVAVVATDKAAETHAPVILVADDNAINRKLLVTLLQQNGYRIMEAASGKALLELADKQSWDLALVDIHMPGMDGIEATTKLIAKLGTSHPPIIAVSADALPETRTRALAAGMRDYLVKPYSEQQLLDMVARYLPKQDASGS